MTGRAQAQRRTVVSRAKGTASCCTVGMLLLAAACSDPRGRPVPPSVRIAIDRPLAVTSPGTLLGNVYLSDPTGLDSIRVTVTMGNGATIGDSTFFTSNDPFTDTIPLLWQIPGAVPGRTTVKLVARARSYIGFTGADSLLTAIGDTLR